MMRSIIWEKIATNILPATSLLLRGFIYKGVAVEMGDDMAIYKPHLRVQYNINESWWTAFRYRYRIYPPYADGKDDRLVSPGNVAGI